jgi:hypothetical protein
MTPRCDVRVQIADGALALSPTAFGALGALGIIGAALFVADPEKRCARFDRVVSVGFQVGRGIVN